MILCEYNSCFIIGGIKLFEFDKKIYYSLHKCFFIDANLDIIGIKWNIFRVGHKNSGWIETKNTVIELLIQLYDNKHEEMKSYLIILCTDR